MLSLSSTRLDCSDSSLCLCGWTHGVCRHLGVLEEESVLGEDDFKDLEARPRRGSILVPRDSFDFS